MIYCNTVFLSRGRVLPLEQKASVFSLGLGTRRTPRDFSSLRSHLKGKQ